MPASDVSFALRMIRRRPWFSAAIVTTLALGIGVNTTVFSLVNAVLFKPLPFQGGDRLMMAFATNPGQGQDRTGTSYLDYIEFRKSQQSFESLQAVAGQRMIIGENGIPPERFRGSRFTSGMFAMLHATPVLGRTMQPEDEKLGGPRLVWIGYRIWKNRYGGSPSVIGRNVRINEKPAVIAGVMPDGFRFPNNEDIWTPLVPDDDAMKRGVRAFDMIGLLKPGVTKQQATADLARTAASLAQAYPDTNKGYSAVVLSFHEAQNGGPIRVVFLLMLGAVGFVLLIACANVANMLLGRAVERTAEMSVRAALGASRWRVIRQLLIESVILSAIGGLLGLAIASYGTRTFAAAVENVGKPYWIEFSMNYTVFGYFALLTILAGIAFGIAPALIASRVDLNEALKGTSRGAIGGRTSWLSSVLVTGQFMLAVVLLCGAGLMVRSFFAAQKEYAAIQSGNILSARVSLPATRYPKPEDRQRFYETLQTRASALPGVQVAAITLGMPGDGRAVWTVDRFDKPETEEKKRVRVSGVPIGSGYFTLLGMRVLRGRDFNSTDGMPGKEAVLVNRRFADRMFPGQDPLGRQVRIWDESGARAWMTIVGITPDVRQQSISENTVDPVIFVPYRFESPSGMAIGLRGPGDPANLASTLRTEVQKLDQDLALSDAMPLDELFGKARWYLRVFGTLFLIFATVAMGMAAVGVYGVMAHSTLRRTREIGVRLALGAGGGTILRLVLGRGLVQLGIGITLGLGIAFGVCRLMGRLLFGVSSADPLTFSVVSLTLAAIGIAAIWIPARRASRLNPVNALRYE